MTKLIENSLFLGCVLLIITIIAAFEYYRQINKSEKEYKKAKEVVKDVVLSFNKELKREKEKINVLSYKAEAYSSKTNVALKEIKAHQKQLASLESKVEVISEDRKKRLIQLNDCYKILSDVKASQEILKTKITGFEEQGKQFAMIPEIKGETVIPIKRDKAISPLTRTELAVLEMLSLEGAKTAPEIKEKIKLSREHTARLMKKLYEEGYLERETSKIPFKYSVKKEMKKLLEKSEH